MNGYGLNYANEYVRGAALPLMIDRDHSAEKVTA
ncbi:Uncharacterised protein [Yersinia pekkanenii]|uniref:Uncharacterized protein n=1 Tax=Yersinia pekkanenii TaxID=1288385 RepID=A0A0T9NF16_9GAMM|nr:Uncharacterised protein [Yersinia pekkanenii]CRY63920.1 Uncharacterised protein [Yersinia pekkanenii]